MTAPAFKDLPPLLALAAFEAVARLHSFARAADELCVTHGAVSHRIKVLEQHYGVRFFARRGGTVTLTTKGAYFLEAVLDALSTLQHASKRLADTRRIVTVSAGPSTAHNWLVSRLDGFYREHPGIDLEITVTKLAPRKRHAGLETGEADVVIRYGRKEDWSGFQSVKLMDVELYPVCSPAYLAKMGRLDTPEALRKAQLLRLPHEPWKPWFEAAGLSWQEPASGPVFSDASLILDAVANAQGVALARNVLVERDIASGRLVRLWSAAVFSPRAYFAVWSAQGVVRPEVSAFLEWLKISCRPSLATPHPGARAARKRKNGLKPGDAVMR
jgi:LysR family glycine cleavage system transcriptional activator